MTTGKIIGDRDLALIDQGVQLLPYNLFSGQGDCLSKVNPITEPLASSERAKLLLAAAGRLEKVADAKVEFVPLLQTTREGGTRTFSGMDLMSMQQNPEQLWRAADKGADNGFVLAGERIVTAAIVSGKFKSAFPDGLPGAATNGGDNVDPKDGEKPDAKDGEKPDAKDGEKKPAEPKHLKEAVAENSVVIVADVDVISSGRMFVNPPNSFPPDQFSNKELLLNALDYLGGSGELMSIRSRAPARREFDHIESIRREAAKRTQDKVDSIKREIESFQATLSDLNSKATEKNVGVLQGEALQQQREAKKKIAAKERELRDVQRGAVEEVESVKWHAQLFNAVGMPLLVGLIGLVLWIVSLSRRSKKMREDMA
jgi:hypothetical protein